MKILHIREMDGHEYQGHPETFVGNAHEESQTQLGLTQPSAQPSWASCNHTVGTEIQDKVRAMLTEASDGETAR